MYPYHGAFFLVVDMGKIQVGDLVRLTQNTCGIPRNSLCLVEEVSSKNTPSLYRVKSLNGICAYNNAFGGKPGAFIDLYAMEFVTSTNQKFFNPPPKPTLPITMIANGDTSYEKTSQLSQGDS